MLILMEKQHMTNIMQISELFLETKKNTYYFFKIQYYV